MKKVKLLMLLIIPFLLTGCANTLKCEIETDNYNSKIKVKFENDKPTTYKFKDEMIFKNTLDTDSEIYYHTKYAEYNYLINDKLARVTNSQDKVTIKITYDFTKDNSQGEENLLIKETDSMKNAIKKIESSGYKCK